MAIEGATSYADLQRQVAQLEAELAAARGELAEAGEREAEGLDREAATAEILRAIAGAPSDLRAVLNGICESAARLCDAAAAGMWRVSGDEMEHVAGRQLAGPSLTFLQAGFRQPIGRGFVAGRAVADRAVVHVADLHNPVELGREPPGPAAVSRRFGHRTALAAPLLFQGEPIGAILVIRTEVRLFSDRQIALLQTFADQAVIAIENARLFQELDERNRELTEALEQQTATAEVLRVIATSPTDLQRVLDTVVQSAMRLSDSATATLWIREGDQVRAVTQAGHSPTRANLGDVLPLTTRLPGVRALVERRIIHNPDRSDPAVVSEFPDLVDRAAVAALSVPLIRETEAIGLINVGRDRAQPYSHREIALIEIFADQAVIAIENARLFQELQDSNRELEEKSAQLAAASRHKSEFLANMSHELRIPLNAINGFSEVLLERYFGELNAKQEDYLRDIASSGQHLLSLINDILDLSKVEAGRMELEVSEFSLREALQNGLTMLRERAARHGIDLTLEIEDGLDEIEADERKIKQVVFNLLSNAVKFTPDGGRVAVRAQRADGEIRIAVADTGVGISTEDLHRLFEEFRQVGRGRAQTEGTGLGLALAKKLVQLHGGTIRVESEPGRGSTFTVMLPQPEVGHTTSAPR